MIWRLLQSTRTTVLIWAGVLIAAIALLDWRVDLNIYFGFLYVFPMLLAGMVLRAWPILGAALLCTVLSELFDPFRFQMFSALPQDLLVFSALSGMGLLSREVTRGRQRERENLQRVEMEASARRQAEQQ